MKYEHALKLAAWAQRAVQICWKRIAVAVRSGVPLAERVCLERVF